MAISARDKDEEGTGAATPVVDIAILGHKSCVYSLGHVEFEMYLDESVLMVLK